MEIPSALEDRAKWYLSVHGAGEKMKEVLGYGTDGAVWATTRSSARKVFERKQGHFNERDCYKRLAEFGVTRKISGFWVPEMHGWDDTIMAIEMDIMQEPPYIIDFAKSRIDRPPEFSIETLEESKRNGRELFEDNWHRVARLLTELESFQIYYLDPKPHNIVFPAN